MQCLAEGMQYVQPDGASIPWSHAVMYPTNDKFQTKAKKSPCFHWRFREAQLAVSFNRKASKARGQFPLRGTTSRKQQHPYSPNRRIPSKALLRDPSSYPLIFWPQDLLVGQHVGKQWDATKTSHAQGSTGCGLLGFRGPGSSAERF